MIASSSLTRYSQRALLSFLGIMMAGCAGQYPPSGGPVDTSPPTIVSTIPKNNSTNMTAKSISITFNKYVDRRSVEESIFISPPVGSLEFDWSGKEVTVSWTKPLRKNTTYVVTLGTDIVDTRNRNRLAQAYSFAFSTGERIDQASVMGKVYDAKPAGVMIFCYDLTSRVQKTCNPITEPPDFISQTGNDGSFKLSNLPTGIFRIFAVRDEYRNLRYDPGVDDIGVPPGDVQIDSTTEHIANLNFLLTKEDTIPPRLLLASAFDNQHVELRMSEDIDTAHLAQAKITIGDSSGTSLPVISWFVNPVRPTSIIAITAPQREGMGYKVTLDSIWDRSGLRISSSVRTATFTGNGKPDTLRPYLSWSSLSDSARGVLPQPTVLLSFSNAIEERLVNDSLRFTDSLGAAVPHQVRWIDGATVDVSPTQMLTPNMRYSITLPADALRTKTGIPANSSFTRTFFTAPASSLSSLSGLVQEQRKDGQVGRFIVEATRIEPVPPLTFTTAASETGAFRVADIPEGRYVLRAYRTSGKSTHYAYGTAVPFHPAAPFAVLSDTIRVRARWPVEGITITIPFPHGIIP